MSSSVTDGQQSYGPTAAGGLSLITEYADLKGFCQKTKSAATLPTCRGFNCTVDLLPDIILLLDEGSTPLWVEKYMEKSPAAEFSYALFSTDGSDFSLWIRNTCFSKL